MDKTVTPTYARIEFLQRRLLRARDMQDASDYLAAMRGLHVVGLHKTWGVALGLEVYRSGELDQRIHVTPGLAYDANGQEMVLSEHLYLDLPTKPTTPPPADDDFWWFDLCLAYDADLSREDCGLDGGMPVEHPLLRWHFAGSGEQASDDPGLAPSVRLGEEVPLAHIARVPLPQGGWIALITYSTRRVARGLVRPFIAQGQVSLNAAYDRARAAWTLAVDTSSAGFTQTPHYFAQLANHPVYDAAQGNPELLEAMRAVVGPFVSVRNASAGGFDLDARFGIDPDRERGANLEVPATLPFTINWVGVEALDGSTLTALQTAWQILITGFEFGFEMSVGA